MMVQISAWLFLFTKKCIFGCYWMMLQQSPSVLSTELFLHIGNALCYDYFPSCPEVLANWSGIIKGNWLTHKNWRHSTWAMEITYSILNTHEKLETVHIFPTSLCIMSYKNRYSFQYTNTLLHLKAWRRTNAKRCMCSCAPCNSTLSHSSIITFFLMEILLQEENTVNPQCNRPWFRGPDIMGRHSSPSQGARDSMSCNYSSTSTEIGGDSSNNCDTLASRRQCAAERPYGSWRSEPRSIGVSSIQSSLSNQWNYNSAQMVCLSTFFEHNK